MITREFRCAEHGDFSSKFSICPHGCVDVQRIHTSAPAMVSRRTKNIDATFKQMAKDYNMTDLKNDKGTLVASIAPTPRATPEVEQYMAIQKQMNGGEYSMDSSGSYWATGTRFQQGKAKVTGKLSAVENIPVPTGPKPIVQAACDANGRLTK